MSCKLGRVGLLSGRGRGDLVPGDTMEDSRVVTIYQEGIISYSLTGGGQAFSENEREK